MRVPEPKTILAVDHDPKALLELMTRLSQAGFHVQSATTAADALRIVQARRLDAVTVNAALPGDMDGFGMATALRDGPRTRTLPVIILAANGDRDFVSKCKAAGIKHFVSKPRDTEQLVRQLQGIFEQDRLIEVEAATDGGRRQST